MSEHESVWDCEGVKSWAVELMVKKIARPKERNSVRLRVSNELARVSARLRASKHESV